MITRPLLAVELERLEDAKLPVLVSPKLDGIRCIKLKGKVLTRSFKDIPNEYIRNYLQTYAPDGLDGEIVTYTGEKLDEFNVIQSKVMSEDGEPNFIFAVFDYVTGELNEAFSERFSGLQMVSDPKIMTVKHTLVNTVEELKTLEAEYVAAGYEGIMLRDPNGRYKCGRSTLKEGILLKYKRFEDSEAEILEINEQLTNIGERGTNELGKTKRSYKKADMAPAGTMGEFKVRDLYTKQEFGIGTGEGLTKELRQELWNNKDKYIGKIVKYKYQGCGQKDLPRFPSFQGFRDPRDMS